MRRIVLFLVTTLAWAAPAQADGPVPTTLPPGFPVIQDAALGVPVIGFGSPGAVTRTPLIIVHGNNDTPFPTTCNGSYGYLHNLATYLHAHGWTLPDLWGLGWQGDQCDIQTDPTKRAGTGHTVAANVADLRAFVAAVRAFTGARQVDLVAHSLGSTLVREWLRQDNAYDQVRRAVMVDGTNHGIINCSPAPQNIYALPALGGFTPDSPLCREVGALGTPLMAALNAGDETPGPTRWTTIYNADTSFVYFSKQDGAFPPVPAQDRDGRPHDFSRSALLDGAENVALTAQNGYGGTLGAVGAGTAHVGISNSPEMFAITESALKAPDPVAPAAGPVPRAAPRSFSLTARREGRRTLRLAGRLRAPEGMTVARACRGTVVLTVTENGRTVSSRRAALRGDCRYAVRIRFRRLGRRLRVRAVFAGNGALRPKSARVVAVP